MYSLGINTAGAACEAAVLRGDVVLAERREDMARGHDQRLAPIIDAVMREAGIAFSELTSVAVAVGPGSFTGVRVGVAFARGLAAALSIPSYGVTSLAGLLPVDPPLGRILAVSPAKKRPPELSWWAEEFEDAVSLCPPAEIDLDALRARASLADLILSDASFDRSVLPELQVTASALTAISVAHAARLGRAASSPASPVYVRAPDATPMRAPPAA
ncbi:MAG: tRNA (adenosine(37)-N6)-threonylcarbamoyltransferase complex dimerization subunit type 1 TsaB [Pseudomonadota bacterium]